MPVVIMNGSITKAMSETERVLHQVQQIAGLGIYVMDIPKKRYSSSEILDEIFGITSEYPHTTEGWLALVHPDDRQMMAEYFAKEVVGLSRRFNKEYRIIRVADGAVRWLHGHGNLEFDENKIPVLMIGTIQDVTERKSFEKALQQSETRYRELIDLAVDGILVGSHDGVIIDANRYLCDLVGMRRDELVGKYIKDIPFTPESLVSSPLRFDLVQKGETVVSERQIIHPDGSLVIVEMRSKMMPDGNYQSIIRDITERKTTENSLLNFTKILAQRVEERTRELEKANASLKLNLKKLRSSQVLLSEMGRLAKVGGWEMDIHSGKQVWTEEVYRIHEVDMDFEPTAEKGISFYAPEARPIIEEAVRRCREEGEAFNLELEFITAKGNVLWVNANGKADLEHGRIHGTFQDVTERRRADGDLREKNAALDHSVALLRKLTMELTQAEELERKRLAGILHDHVQQYIAAATMKISLLDSNMSAAEHARGVKETLALLGEALDSSRSLSVSLCPPVLLEAGLMPGLRWLADWMENKHGLLVKIIGGNIPAVSGSLNILLFQAVRELLFNVVKHAGVNQAVVLIEHPEIKSLRLVVVDHGKGFSFKESQSRLLPGGFGLFHLRERLAYIGGGLDVKSEIGKGSRVSLSVPL